MTFLNSAKIKHAHASLRVPKRDLEERLFYRRRASPRFYTWGNSGLEPYLGSGNRLSSIDEAHLWGLAIMEGLLQWSTMSD